MRKFLIIVLFLLSLLSYSHASRGQYIASMVTGSVLGFGIGNFVVGHVGPGIGYLFGDLFYTGLILIWAYGDIITTKVSEKIPDTSVEDIESEKSKAEKNTRVALMVIGLIGVVLLVISRIVQVYQAHAYYRDNIGFANYNNQLKHKYAQSRSVLKNFDVGLMTISFRKTL